MACPPPSYSNSTSISRTRTNYGEIECMANTALQDSLAKKQAAAWQSYADPQNYGSYHGYAYHDYSKPPLPPSKDEKLGYISKPTWNNDSASSHTKDRLRKVEYERDELVRMVQEARTDTSEAQHLARRQRALVERLKRESAAAGGEGQSESDARLRVKQLKRDTRTAHAELSRESPVGLFKSVCSTDLLFLVDTTGSMDYYIYTARRQILNIVNDVKKYFLGEAEVRVAVVSYKDHDQDPNIQILDFTSSIEDVRSFLGGLTATGGNDAPEDVLGGIRLALNASWKQQTRCIIHIADEPPHGRNLHDYLDWGDSYPEPGTEPHGLTYQPLLKEMIDLNINYALLRIGEATDRMAYEFFRMYRAAGADGMIHQFNRYYDRAYNESVGIQFGSVYGGYSERSTKSGLLFKEAELGTKFEVLRHLIVSIVTDSASRTALRTSERRTGRLSISKKPEKDLFTINENGASANDVQLERSHPRWDVPGWLDEKRMVEGFSLDVVAHDTDTLESMMEKDDNIKMGATEFTIERRSRPFAQGAMRRAYYARTAASTNLYVLKSFIRNGKRLPHMVEDMRCQALSKAFALEFNTLVEDHPIDFTVTTCFKGDPITGNKTGDEYMSLEPYIEGTYVKYNNNCGYITDQNPHDRFNIAAQAFSHFTFERSQGRFLVCDLQGVGYQLTDPSIHTLDPKRFKLSDTNLGKEGFKFFFASHVCNDICARLDLKSSASMLVSGNFEFRQDWPHIPTTVCCSNKLCGRIVRMTEETVPHVQPGYYWCQACIPQLYMFTNNWICTEPGGMDHEFEVSRFFWESQGQRVPRKCEAHRKKVTDGGGGGTNGGTGGGGGTGEKTPSKVRRFSGEFWARVKSGNCFRSTAES